MLKKITKQQKEKLVGIVTIVLVAIVGIMLVSSRVSSSRSISPNAPDSNAEASDGGPMCNGTKCCQNCECVNSKCILSNPSGGNKEVVQKKTAAQTVSQKPTLKTVVQKVFSRKTGKIKAK